MGGSDEFDELDLASRVEMCLRTRSLAETVAHDVRIHLANIITLGEMYVTDLAEQSEYRERVQDIHNIVAASNIINKVFELIIPYRTIEYHANSLDSTLLTASVNKLHSLIKTFLQNPLPLVLYNNDFNVLIKNKWEAINGLLSSIDLFEFQSEKLATMELERAAEDLMTLNLPSNLEIEINCQSYDGKQYRSKISTRGSKKSLEPIVKGTAFGTTKYNIRDLVLNLVGNSLKYAWKLEDADDKRIIIRYIQNEDGSGVLTVKDNGTIDTLSILNKASELGIKLDGRRLRNKRPFQSYMLELLTTYGISTSCPECEEYGSNKGSGLAHIREKFKDMRLKYRKGLTEFRIYLPASPTV